MSATYLGTDKNFITNESFLEILDLSFSGFKGDITWLRFSKDGKRYMIPSRPLCGYPMSWNQLNAKGLVQGKHIEINGVPCFCRLMTGATSNPGTKAGGEYDEFMYLPPSELITTCITACAEDGKSLSYFVGRGDGGSSPSLTCFYNNLSKSEPNYSNIGFRPILEILNNKPFVITDEYDLGKISDPILINYSIEDLDNDPLTVEIILNGETLSVTEGLSNGEFVFDLPKYWSYAKYTDNILTLKVSDGKESSSAEIKFEKIKKEVHPIPLDSDFNKIISHLNNIKSDKIIDRLRLSTILDRFGIETLENDTMNVLIDKVKTIKKKWIIGEMDFGTSPLIPVNLTLLETDNNNKSMSCVKIPKMDFTPSYIYFEAIDTHNNIITFVSYEKKQGVRDMIRTSYKKTSDSITTSYKCEYFKINDFVEDEYFYYLPLSWTSNLESAKCDGIWYACE